jgi:hypothetical protein
MRILITTTLSIILLFISAPTFAQLTDFIGAKTHNANIKEENNSFNFSLYISTSAISRLDRASETDKVFSITIDKLGQEKKATGTFKALYTITSVTKDEKNDNIYEVTAVQKGIIKNEIDLPNRFDPKNVSFKYTFSEDMNSLEFRDIKKNIYFNSKEEVELDYGFGF